jgi:hypothetical protein
MAGPNLNLSFTLFLAASLAFLRIDVLNVLSDCLCNMCILSTLFLLLFHFSILSRALSCLFCDSDGEVLR